MSNITINKWRIFCNTSNHYKYVWNDTGITQCPVNNAHTVSGDAIIIDSVPGTRIDSSNSPYTFSNKSILADTTDGDITINLLKAVRMNKKTVVIKKVASNNTLSVIPFSGDSIGGSTSTYSMTGLNDTLIIKSNGVGNWNVYNDIISVDIKEETLSQNKGDILVDNGECIVKLDVGSNNKVLTADSTTDTGVAWKDITTIYSNPCSLYSTSFIASRTQPFLNIATTSDSTITIFSTSNTSETPTQMVVIGCMSSIGSTGTITLKNASTLATLATIVIPSTVITPTRYTATITGATGTTMFLLAVKTTSSSKTTNIYSLVIS